MSSIGWKFQSRRATFGQSVPNLLWKEMRIYSQQFNWMGAVDLVQAQAIKDTLGLVMEHR